MIIHIDGVYIRTYQSICYHMILQHVKSLNAIKIVLASASPRRKEILGNIGLTVEVRVH